MFRQTVKPEPETLNLIGIFLREYFIRKHKNSDFFGIDAAFCLVEEYTDTPVLDLQP